MTKEQALATHLESNTQMIKESTADESLFYCGNESYLVLNYSEANIRTLASIRDGLWCFDAEFISRFMDIESNQDIVNTIKNMQKTLSVQDCNEMLYALVRNRFDELLRAAIATRGRGMFLAHYDFEEVAIQDENNWMFIYRVN